MAPQSKPKQCALLTRTVELLRTRPRQLTLTVIAEATGVSIAWLTALGSDTTNELDPSVNRVVAVYEFLSHRRIEL